MGDPSGIGPEVCLKALLDPTVDDCCDAVVIGDASVLRAEAEKLGVVGKLQLIVDVAELDRASGGVSVMDLRLCLTPPGPGAFSAATGQASLAYIERAIELARRGSFDGVVTAPISKKALDLAGCTFPGHTEIFAERTGTKRYAMLMYSERMSVALVTCHQPLRSVPDTLTVEGIVETGELLHETLLRLRGNAPRIACLGLNPHAGEGGVLGAEDGALIAPAIERLRELGLDVEGPLPPDTAFTPAALSRFDGHLCMYHDQGLIPFKMLCMEEGINMTMGLPFVRTSPDHGTAFDIAGKGVASPASMVSAIRLAARAARL